MTVEEVKDVLKRKMEECEKDSAHAKDPYQSSWYDGKSRGIDYALGIIGMLGNDHNRGKETKNNKFG